MHPKPFGNKRLVMEFNDICPFLKINDNAKIDGSKNYEKEVKMPNVYVDGPKLDLDKKRRLAVEITDALERAYGLPRQVYVVIIRDNPPENVCVGGVMICDREKTE